MYVNKKNDIITLNIKILLILNNNNIRIYIIINNNYILN